MLRNGDGFTIEISVKNTGTRAGAVIPQLYVSCRQSAVFRVDKELKGFGRIELAAAERAVLLIELNDDELCYYDEEQRAWQLEACRYELRVGQCSGQLPLHSSWCFDGANWNECH